MGVTGLFFCCVSLVVVICFDVTLFCVVYGMCFCWFGMFCRTAAFVWMCSNVSGFPTCLPCVGFVPV